MSTQAYLVIYNLPKMAMIHTRVSPTTVHEVTAVIVQVQRHEVDHLIGDEASPITRIISHCYPLTDIL